ncbi:MAG: SpoIID/LytB domain-containing protein [Candidatus Hydrogenedentota bacterium]
MRPGILLSRTQLLSFCRRGVMLAVALAVGTGCQMHPAPGPARPPVDEPPSPSVEAPPDDRPERLAETSVRILVVEDAPHVAIHSRQPMTLRHSTGVRRLPAGTWTFRVLEAAPPARRHHVFVERFGARHREDAYAEARAWRERGYPAEVFPLGSHYETDSGDLIDNRQFWVAVGRFGSADEASALQRRLDQKEDKWSWTRAEHAGGGKLQVEVIGPGQAHAGRFEGPMELSSEVPMEFARMEGTLIDPRFETARFTGALELAPSSRGTLAVFEQVGLEAYLAGVLPAEMPPRWPEEALKAQAVAARTEALVNRIDKHYFEGYDFCTAEHCRVYGAHAAWHPRTLEALQETAGEVLTYDDTLVPAVYSANCGGWTEDNDAVWDAEPHPALRGRPDTPTGSQDADSPATMGVRAWREHGPDTFCSADENNYGWTERFTRDQLTERVNQSRDVGTIWELEFGERGESGRHTVMRVTGSRGSATFERESAIRLALGGLPSALFDFETEQDGGQTVFTFVGAGRGHGVGLCQHGARGRAQAGASYDEILDHYFMDARLERLR